MEKRVRIIEQSQLTTRQYQDKKTGEERVANSVVLKLTDGLDTFVAEITGERAVNCPQFDKTREYRVQCTMNVRTWTSQSGEQMQANTIYVERINLC